MNIKINIITFLFLLPIILFSQQKIKINNSCSYYGERIPTDLYTFGSDNDAQTALALITNASGLPTNFKLMAANVPNACATLIWNQSKAGYDRYILYNQNFIRSVSQTSSDWSALSILAHEVGHHLSGHSLLAGGSKPELELEADKFSGFILARLGSTLEQALSAVNLIANENYSPTHPSKSARIAAISNGWINSKGSNRVKSNAQEEKVVSSSKRPNFSSFKWNDMENIKWIKENGSLRIYYRPTMYNLKRDTDFKICNLDGFFVGYLFGWNGYFFLDNFDAATQNVELDIKDFIHGGSSTTIIVKGKTGGYWLLDEGKAIDDASSTVGNYYFDPFGKKYDQIYKSSSTGKTYWFSSSDYNAIGYFKPIDVYIR